MTDARITQAFSEIWATFEPVTTDLRVTQSFMEAWVSPNGGTSDSRATQCFIEVWLAPGPYVPPPQPPVYYCASDPQDATGDPGSPGVGMTSQLAGAIVPNNPPVDASGTYPGSTGTGQTPQVADNAANVPSTGTGITSVFGSQIVCRVKPVDAGN